MVQRETSPLSSTKLLVVDGGEVFLCSCFFSERKDYKCITRIVAPATRERRSREQVRLVWGYYKLIHTYMKFTKEQHKMWEALIIRQLPNVKKFACKEYLEGLKIVKFPMDKIPNPGDLSKRIKPHTGWSIVRTNIHYLDQKEWYEHTLKKQFPTTSYIRTWDEFEFTPDPDLFHDMFGHIPIVAIPETVEILEMFAEGYKKIKTREQSKDLARLAWFSYEFGLVKEKGKIRIFGGGILSSHGETLNVMNGNVSFRPFTIKEILQKNKSLGSYNKELFIAKSITQMKQELSVYFNSL